MEKQRIKLPLFWGMQSIVTVLLLVCKTVTWRICEGMGCADFVMLASQGFSAWPLQEAQLHLLDRAAQTHLEEHGVTSCMTVNPGGCLEAHLTGLWSGSGRNASS